MLFQIDCAILEAQITTVGYCHCGAKECRGNQDRDRSTFSHPSTGDECRAAVTPDTRRRTSRRSRPPPRRIGPRPRIAGHRSAAQTAAGSALPRVPHEHETRNTVMGRLWHPYYEIQTFITGACE